MGSVRLSFTASLLLYIASAGGAAAQEEWTASPVDATSLPSEIASETRLNVLDGLPDGLVAAHTGKGDIVSAWYGAPTTRYGHSILAMRSKPGNLL